MDFVPNSNKIEHERLLLNFEEDYPKGCPMDIGTLRALLIIHNHVGFGLDKASDEISDAWHAILDWLDAYL